jgi:anti-sigma factor RsiW
MMDLRNAQPEFECPLDDISPYLDGELTPSRELELEIHFASCESCRAELNLQKKFLIALDHALEGEEEVDLPANFTRLVVANAESRVSGLRRRSERFNAFFVCSGLFLIIIFALGASGSNTALDTVFVIFEKVVAVASFVAHMVYDIAVGAIVILRSLASRFVVDSSIKLLFPGMAVVYIYIVSRLTHLFSRN